MASVKIIKGKIQNIVDEVLFEKIYKPNGWVIDEQELEQTEDVPESIQTASQLKNYQKMKTKSQRSFNDGLFYSDKE